MYPPNEKENQREGGRVRGNGGRKLTCMGRWEGGPHYDIIEVASLIKRKGVYYQIL